jgi:diguanylate cyclase (GGDEF)-like protein/PAS domain S-box-containing protein
MGLTMSRCDEGQGNGDFLKSRIKRWTPHWIAWCAVFFLTLGVWPHTDHLAFLVLLSVAVSALYSWHRMREQRLLQRLKISEDRLSMAIDANRLALWDWDLISGKMLADDVRMNALLGYKLGEVQADDKWFAKQLHPDDWPAVKAALHDVLKGIKSQFVLEHRLKHKNGDWVWLLALGKVASRDVNGRATRMVGTDVDITERKHLETSERESRDLLKNLTDQVPAELFQFRIDPLGRACFPYVSKHFLEFYGLTLEQVQQDASVVFAWQHPDDKAALQASIAHAAQTLELWQHEYRLLLPNGRVVWRSGRAQPQKLDDGTVLVHGAILDITERKLAEESLRIAAVAFEASSAMMVSDANKKILRVNPAFTALTGYSVEEAVGQDSKLLRSVKHDADFYADMRACLSESGHWQGEIWNRRKNGELFLDWLRISAVKDPQGNTTHFVALHTNITLRKKVEDDIKRLAFYDPLTELPNRRLLIDRLEKIVAACTRNGQMGAVLFIDLDRFKLLNDTHGHDIGDLLLQQVACRLQLCVREVDTVARLGGDEFVVALAQLGEDRTQAQAGAMGVSRKVLDALNEPFDLAGHAWTLSASIGIALLENTSEPSDSVLRNADHAMYEAKAAGRNGVRFFGLSTMPRCFQT